MRSPGPSAPRAPRARPARHPRRGGRLRASRPAPAPRSSCPPCISLRPGRAVTSMPRMTRPAALALALCLAPLAAPAQEQPAGAAPPAAAPAEPPAAKPPAKKAALPRELYATFVTSQGKIGIRLFPEQKPASVKNFVELAEGKKAWTDPRTGQRSTKPLYDGTVFHRVIPGFMIQGGDPLGLGV